MRLKIDDRFTRELPADPVRDSSRRQVTGAAFSFVSPRVPTRPRVLHVAPDVAEMIGLEVGDLTSDTFRDLFSGAAILPGMNPYSMCYGGHQFGNWAGQLGDGRAINLAEVEHRGSHWTLQLKGAGETPYSRTADGLAVLRSSIREHLCSEAMYHLGVPTTRSLCVLTTGDQVVRDVMYSGNPQLEPGAVVCRVAKSFIRFGSFEIFAAQDDKANLKRLADYTIRHHFPEVEAEFPSANGGNDGVRYAQMFRRVCESTLEMVLHWQRVGFVHGVMNTDNMSIHGDTIDYGPYGWLEPYQPDWTPNTTDRSHRRYRYGNQPSVAMWNLAQLANALFPLVGNAEPLESSLQSFAENFNQKWTQIQAQKIGLDSVVPSDETLLSQLDDALQLCETDMTIFYRSLANVDKTQDIAPEGDAFLAPVRDAFYDPTSLEDGVLQAWREWFGSYVERLRKSHASDSDRLRQMNRVNPKYVLRNYMAQLAIDDATLGESGTIEELYDLLRHPYDEQPEMASKWFAKRPEWARNKVGCSMLSCSS